LLGGITGIVLFIVGLVRQKPSIWGSGIVLGVLTLLLFAGGVVALVNYLFTPIPSPQMRILVYDSNASSTASVPWDPNSELAAIDLQAAKEYFQDRVGVALPEHVSVVRRQNFMFFPSGGGPGKDTCLLKLSIPADFETFLAANFRKAQWPDVKDAFGQLSTFRENVDLSPPEDGRRKALPFYTFTQPDDPNADVVFTTSVAIDPNSRKAWVVGEGRHKK
jgi:hypothetical protein